ncbi:MAG: hypothetical protein B6230_02625 [Desulfobacteraceae bacterium 4572_89]|nr:MAG: hypothetical protein B6230_02625 [Desulfobacteraceae bacterium 4572_89]
MPGFNQRGPMNEGPMTGRRQGVCGRGTDSGAQGGTFDAMGYGRGRGMGRRGGSGPGWGRGYGQMNTSFTPPATEESLKMRAQTLEAELDAIKNDLAKLSKS